MRWLTEDEVLEMVAKHVGDHLMSPADFKTLAKSHEALRARLVVVESRVDDALKTLNRIVGGS